MLTAAQIITEAIYRASVPGYDQTFAPRNLNSILSDLCQDYDFALARGQYNFNFNPSLSTMFGSGPYNLPADYLRTSGSSGAMGASRSAWYLYPTPAFPQGQPIYMTPIDLAEFDQYPQFPSQSTPELWATDMGAPITQRIVLSCPCSMTDGSAVITPQTMTGLVHGLGVAGEGITAGTRIQSVASSTVTLTKEATQDNNVASVFFGIPPVAYVYPPPLGNYPVTVRYQRQMPPIVNMNSIPWFPVEGFLIHELAGRICEIARDGRAQEFHANALRMLTKYLQKSDDKTNRAQAIQLDPRNYGGGTAYSRARMTKYAGWLVLLTISLGGMMGAPLFG